MNYGLISLGIQGLVHNKNNNFYYFHKRIIKIFNVDTFIAFLNDFVNYYQIKKIRSKYTLRIKTSRTI